MRPRGPNSQTVGLKLQTKVLILLGTLTLCYVFFFWKYSSKEGESIGTIATEEKTDCSPCPKQTECLPCAAACEIKPDATPISPAISSKNKKQLYQCDIPNPNFLSQVGQDKWVYDKFFTNRCGGVYLDIGAHDGKGISNSYFFEHEANWRGMCVEPNPQTFKTLAVNRPRCININAVLGQEKKKMTFRVVKGVDVLSGLVEFMDPRHLDRIAGEKKLNNLKDEDIYDVQVDMLQATELLEVHDMLNIDFLSLDTEGSELQILRSFDWSKINIHVMTVENNFRSSDVKDYLKEKGITFVNNLSGQDDLYVDNNYCAKTGIC